jgi:hypothetical protein
MYKIIGKNKKTGIEMQWGERLFVRMEANAFIEALKEIDPEAEYRVEKV